MAAKKRKVAKKPAKKPVKKPVKKAVKKAVKSAAKKATAKKRALTEYARKRDFKQTSEPSGRESTPLHPTRTLAAETKAAKKAIAAMRAKGERLFVVQHHKASHDHHDFRLEHKGVLLSWAVPKHVSTKVGERRLAVEVEDHPLDYATFQGTIPEGNYGAGTVRTYDIGTWESEDDVDYGLKKGHLSAVLHGTRLKGTWDLVRMPPRDGESPSKPQWLLIRRSGKK